VDGTHVEADEHARIDASEHAREVIGRRAKNQPRLLRGPGSPSGAFGATSP